MDQFDLEIVLIVVAVPVAMLVVLVLLGSWFRRHVDPRRRRGSFTGTDTPAPVSIAQPPSAPLHVDWFRAGDGPPPDGATDALAYARTMNRSADRAFLVAGLIFTAMLVAIDSQLVDVAPRDRLVFAFLRSFAPLYITLAFVSWPWRRRLATLAAYGIAGLAISVPIGGGPTRTLAVAALWSPLALYIFPGLLLLTLRRLRPLLTLLAALFVFIVAGSLLAMPLMLLIGVRESEEAVLDAIRSVDPWIWLGGAWNFIAGAILLQRLLGLPAARQFASIGFAACALGVALSAGPFQDNAVVTNVIAVTLIGPPVCTAQWYIVWLFFRLLVRIEQQRWLARQPLHFHLCCAVLALYVAAPFTTSGRHLLVLLCLAAFCVEIVVLHALLQHGASRAELVPTRRLLLLRVFGQSDRREKLLDWLDDEWRRAGRIDLVAGTDLAMRALGSRMLEAFLLRRTDTQYLKTPEEVERRLGHMDSGLQNDLRYPLNEVYCYESTWRPVVKRLAVDANVVLMDLRGFTRANLGCAFELEMLTREVPIERVLLLADDSTDRLAVEETVRRAWSSLPAGSPNRRNDRPTLAILELHRRAPTNRDALNRYLFNVAFPNASGSSALVAVGSGAGMSCAVSTRRDIRLHGPRRRRRAGRALLEP